MVTFAETFQQWTDFPKGLHILVVDSDTQFLQDITCKLESYHYCVTSFSSGEEASIAIASHTQTFHVALVEATESNGVDSCKILSFAKDLPTIMMSVMENMSMMVKSIALGAVEFLLKPPSDDKLKNIWQHVVRKALDSSKDSLRPGYLEPGKPTISLSVGPDNQHACCKDDSNISSAEKSQCEGASHSLVLSVPCERFAAPSTPQLEQLGGGVALQEATLNESPRSHDSSEVCNYKEGDNRQNDADNLSCSTISADVKEEAKEIRAIFPDNVAVEEEEGAANEQAQIFFCTIPMLESALHIEDADTAQTSDRKALDSEIKAEDEGLVSKGPNRDSMVTTEVCEMSSTKGYELQDASKSTASYSDTSKDSAECRNTDSTCQSETLGQHHGKDGWKDEGKRKANESENEEKDGKCSKKKFKVDWTADLHRRFVQAVEYLGVEQAIPSRILEVMKVDGLTRHNVASHLQADSWVPGFPSMAPCYPPHTKSFATSGYPQWEGLRDTTWESFPEDAENSSSEAKNGSSKSQLQELYPPKELLDAAINEALSNPWMPLPLGLKPPSMESVMAELQRQGINTLSSIS